MSNYPIYMHLATSQIAELLPYGSCRKAKMNVPMKNATLVQHLCPTSKESFWQPKISSIHPRIGYANKVNDIPLDWALGEFILQSFSDMSVDHFDPMRSISAMGV